jgi:hypothetical protein
MTYGEEGVPSREIKRPRRGVGGEVCQSHPGTDSNFSSNDQSLPDL